MNDKAQGLSLNTIVVAAIVLIVLIVLIGIFTGYFSKFIPSLTGASEQQCSLSAGYTQEDETDGCGNAATRVYANFAKDALPEGKICCKLSFRDCSNELDGFCTSTSCSSASMGPEIPAGNAGCERDNPGTICCKTP